LITRPIPLPNVIPSPRPPLPLQNSDFAAVIRARARTPGSSPLSKFHAADYPVLSFHRHFLLETAMKSKSVATIAAILAAILSTAIVHAQTQTPTPSPALLVLNKAENSLAIVDPATQKVIARIPTGEGPHEIAASPDGKLAVVTNYGAKTPGHSLSAIDLITQSEIHRVDLGPLGRPHGILFADGQAYFTVELNKLIARYDPSTNKLDWLLGVGQNRTHMLVRTKYLNEIFTSNVDSNTVTAIEKSSDPSGWKETNIPVGKGPEGIDISPDDKEVWAANSGDGTVSIIDTATSKVIHTFDVRTKHSNRLKFTPDGKLALISDPATSELVIVDTATRTITKMLNVGRNPGGILIVPDGSRAYVALAGDNAVAVIDLHKLEVSGHIPTGQGPDGLAWAARP
jgi:YVTN family beta-propeller protein